MNEKAGPPDVNGQAQRREARFGRGNGKIILFGEHAVVYGVPAIAAGLRRGATATAAVVGGSGKCSLHLEGLGLTFENDPSSPEPLARAFAALLEVTPGAVEQRWNVTGNMEVTPGAGLGSSAALGVAIARALAPGIPPSIAAERVNAWERVFHGNPSGIDASAAAHGGWFTFRRGVGIEALETSTSMLFCVGNSGTSASTKKLVDMVARMRERNPATISKLFDRIEMLVGQAPAAIHDGDTEAIGELMTRNQDYLRQLNVSTPELDRLCAIACSAGASGAKLTGSGGGGCVIAPVVNEELGERVLAAWNAEGFNGFLSRVSAETLPPPTMDSRPLAREIAR
jgi:mevalonate kinase